MNTITCPHCAQAMSIDESLGSIVIACPHCQGHLQTPGPPPAGIPLDDAMQATIAELRRVARKRRPMTGKTAAETASQEARFSRDHVFVTTSNTPHRAGLLKLFYACCKRAGIEDAGPGGSVDIHSMRVSFATLALESGASPKAVQAILGHATLGMTMNVYAKATDRAKREAISALPFATSSAPEHILSVPITKEARTSQAVTGQNDGSSDSTRSFG